MARLTERQDGGRGRPRDGGGGRGRPRDGWLVGVVSFGTPVRCTAPFPVVSAALCTYSYLLLLLTSFTCFSTFYDFAPFFFHHFAS